jgi:hypothetical protein
VRVLLVLAAALSACASDTRPPATPPPPAPKAAEPDATPAPVADAPEPSGPCHRRHIENAVLLAAPTGERMSIADLLAQKPRAKRITSEGWVVSRRICPPCPEGSECKPCDDNVWLSATRNTGIKQPITETLDLEIQTNASEHLEMYQRYEVTIWTCPHPTRFETELRGYRKLD